MGVALLSNTIANAPENKDKALVAWQALDKVNNPALSGMLIDVFTENQWRGPGNLLFLATGDALSGLATPAATQALLDWMRQAGDTDVQLASRWLKRIARMPWAREQVHQAAKDATVFRSEAVASAAKNTSD